MRIIAVAVLRDFWLEYPDSEQPLKAWFAEARRASWVSPMDVKASYGSASILKDGRVVFNIAGNKYRLVVAISYAIGIVFIKFIGTHKQYDKIDSQKIEQPKGGM
ncbi:MAG: hypothetical protein RJA35_606 [Actinomycetota bacterium]|jgi:mRNA interferase HigB